MKTFLKFTGIVILLLSITACSSDDDSDGPTTLPDLINTAYPVAEQEVMETFGEIAQSIVDQDMDKLISFHAYSPKFTEFKDGNLRNNGAENEAYERELFGVLVKNVVKFAAHEAKISVYGDVANLTFHSDFELDFGDGVPVAIKNQITLLFVNTNEGWKMVHEHHAPLSEAAMNSY